jgi:hypothetical protein
MREHQQRQQQQAMMMMNNSLLHPLVSHRPAIIAAASAAPPPRLTSLPPFPTRQSPRLPVVAGVGDTANAPIHIDDDW